MVNYFPLQCAEKAFILINLFAKQFPLGGITEMRIFTLPSTVVCKVCKNTLMYCHIEESAYQRNADALP